VALPQRVIVSGGTGALGRALVELLVEQKVSVAVPDRREEEWGGLEKALGSPATLFGARADLTDAAGTERFFAFAEEKLGGLDGMALVAGGWAGGARFEEAPDEEWERMLRINLLTVRNACRAALPRLAKSGGSVVTVGARGAETGGSGMAAYAVAKVGVSALTRVLALENRDRGVRFNCVLPGTIDTPANREAMPKADRSGWTAPAAIARVVAFLLSSDSAPVTGALVPVDA